MGLIEELRIKRADLLTEMEKIDREGAKVREDYEERLAGLRERRIPLEQQLTLVDKLIKVEGGK
ncbi:unnamed protein product [marine sediment metagenome]|uniref:Uncharacterized protein n=1 Tax=marine sediment metagenome TaxID=412755 RepID=X1R8R4_9ZZZZ